VPFGFGGGSDHHSRSTGQCGGRSPLLSLEHFCKLIDHSHFRCSDRGGMRISVCALPDFPVIIFPPRAGGGGLSEECWFIVEKKNET
jgi:hypothetical protein